MANFVETPLMKQYVEMKKKHPDAILLFRVGDFYETFSDDAIAASEILGITLTRRANGKAKSVELAGFPHHALDTYLPRLVRAGRRVAICEQLEDPKLTKKLVKRGITELVTPGVNINDTSLKSRENNFLSGVHIAKNGIVGVAFLDLSTGEFLCAEGKPEYIDKLISNIAPKELLRMRGTRELCSRYFAHRCSVYELDDWVYTEEAATERLLKHFSTISLKGFGVDGMKAAIIAAGSLLHYLDITQHNHISHITSLARIDEDKFMRLDRFTTRSLELVEPLSEEGKSLLSVIDRTVTPMGARLMRRWLLFPLVDATAIRRRHDVVDSFFKQPALRSSVSDTLRQVGDLERLGAKTATMRINPRDMLQLGNSLTATANIKSMLATSPAEELRKLAERMADCSEIRSRISHTLNPDAPSLLAKGNVIAPGVNAELDSLREISGNSKNALQAIITRESAATGIPSLKIGFNNVFGYYLEVRNTHRDKVPGTWIRKQTLVNAERYVTQELKEYEERINGAEEKIAAIESQLYLRLVEDVASMIGDVQLNAAATARIDCLLSFAETAEKYNYSRPDINDSETISITNGRHPVIERRLPPGEPYIANSLRLDNSDTQIMMLTGPNMSGKSALLRQTALAVIMAQAGSFIAAESASIGIVDKVFSRVGASDNISSGESTFMVEMNEAAAILNNMSNRSLILFDELGRGTSTYDGISIAWAIVEHIHENGIVTPKTLFATHYHELNEMEKSFRRVVNYNIAVKEINGKILFTRKLERGGSEHSFGINVAKFAGLPPSIVNRSRQVLRQLEEAGASVETSEARPGTKERLRDMGASREGYQLSLFQLDDPLLSQIRDHLLGLDIDNLTPLQALSKLHDLRSLLTGKD